MSSFSHFSPTCFDILSWNFAFDFVLMYYRSSLSFVNLRQFLKELCLFVNSIYRKCAVFCTFLLHALTYWAEILHMTLFWLTTDQVRSSSSVVTFCPFLKELCLFMNLQYRKLEVFRTFVLGALRYWADILHIWLGFNILQIEFKCCLSASVWLSVWPSIFCTCLLYALKIELKIFNFTLVSLMPFF